MFAAEGYGAEGLVPLDYIADTGATAQVWLEEPGSVASGNV